MSELSYTREGPYAVCRTVFGTYIAGFTNYPIWSDIGSDHGETNEHATIYWSKLDKQVLYLGFDVNVAFRAMESDFLMKKAGSLQQIGAAVQRYSE